MLLDTTLQDAPSALTGISDGREGTIETLRVMSFLVRKYKIDPRLRAKALELTRNVSQKNFFGEIRALFDYVQNSVRFVQDVNDVETLATPDKVISQGAGDCDDKSMLLATLLESIGHPTRFKAIGFERDNFAHVYLQTRVGNKWISLDATEPNPPGWEPSGFQEFVLMHN